MYKSFLISWVLAAVGRSTHALPHLNLTPSFQPSRRSRFLYPMMKNTVEYSSKLYQSREVRYSNQDLQVRAIRFTYPSDLSHPPSIETILKWRSRLNNTDRMEPEKKSKFTRPAKLATHGKYVRTWGQPRSEPPWLEHPWLEYPWLEPPWPGNPWHKHPYHESPVFSTLARPTRLAESPALAKPTRLAGTRKGWYTCQSGKSIGIAQGEGRVTEEGCWCHQ
jgi:hypothetical protein